MNETQLRNVLLIRSIDEGDKSFDVLSQAERSEATAAAAANAGTIDQLSGPSLPTAAERLLARRAELLLEKLQARAPVITHVLELDDSARWFAPALLAVAFLFGALMSALDGSQRIDVLAFPLLGLIGWNFAVYASLIAARLRRRRKRPRRSPWFASLYARAVRTRSAALLKNSSLFNVPLAESLQRFAGEWFSISQPGLWLRAERLFHAGAVCLALGLIAGLYTRGLVLRYDAGWESTFLDVEQVRVLLEIVYGPASWLSGIPLPASEELAGLRWSDGAQLSAAPWIHLIALTAVLYIVLPRLLLMAASSAALWRFRRNPEPPASFLPYARAILLETGRVRGLSAAVTVYAFQPSRDALAGLGALLTDALGAQVSVEVRTTVAYGEEDAFIEGLRSRQPAAADCHVLLMSLSATPERENHGAMIAALRRALSKQPAGLLVLIDASSYAARLAEDPAFAGRVEERTRSWREFSAAQGQPATVIDLSRLRAGEEPDRRERDHIRETLQQPVRV
jgi:hypothetical protein